LKPGLLAGRYRPVALLGRGAMGEVWHVTDAWDGDWALKLVTVDSDEHRLALKQEFRVLSQLQHPNVVPVRGYGELADGTPYLVMHVVHGEPVDALAARGRLPLERVLGILLGVTQALAFVHDRGLVHRDLKPANFRLQPDGTVVVMDFGLAGPAGLRPRGITGTPPYMAPEAIRGEPLGPASDLYALGCVAFELLSGLVPFEGEPREILAAHLREAPLSVTAFRPDVPQPLAALVADMLAKEPARRPGGAGEVLRVLAELAGVPATRATVSQRQSYLVSPPLVGRESELAALQRAWARAVAGEGHVVLVAGEGGLGKTRLVDAQALECALDGAVVVRVSAALTGLEPFAALAASVRALVATLGHPPPVLAALLDGGTVTMSPNSAVEWGTALAAWLGQDQAVVWVLEDLHVADLGSVEAFCACGRAAGRARVLLVGTLRPEEVAQTHPLWALAADGTAALVRLRPFDAATFETLVTAALGLREAPHDVLEALFAVSGGSPFALEAILRDLIERDLLVRDHGAWRFPPIDALALPSGATEALLRRVARLSDDVRRLAGLAAVLGAAPTRSALLAVSGTSEAACFDGLEALARAGVLALEAAFLRFVQEGVREALYAALSDEERRAWHRACASHLTEVGAGPAELARHHEAAGDHARAWPCHMRAADASEAAGLPLAAFEQRVWAQRCLVAAGGGDEALLAKLRWQAALVGFNARPREALPLLEALATTLRQQPLVGEGVPALVEVLLILTAANGLAGLPVRAEAVWREAASAGVEDALQSVWLTVRCASWLAAGHFDALLDTVARVRSMLDPLDTACQPLLSRRAHVAAWGYVNVRAYQGAPTDEASMARALALAEHAGAAATGALIRHYQGVWLALAGRVAALEAFLSHEEDAARALGGSPHVSVPCLRAVAAWLRGDFNAGLALVRRARLLGSADEPFASYMDALEARLLAASGEPEAGAALATAAAARAEQAGLELPQAVALLALGAIAARHGDHAKAHAALTTARVLTREGADARNPACEAVALRLLAELALEAGALGEAEACLAAAATCLASPDLDLALERGMLAHARGRLHAALGDAGEARTELVEAARHFRAVDSVAGLHAVQQALQGLAPPVDDGVDDWDALDAWLAEAREGGAP
jgi:hypothetical protein